MSVELRNPDHGFVVLAGTRELGRDRAFESKDLETESNNTGNAGTHDSIIEKKT